MPTPANNWTEEQQRLFWRIYRHMRNNQSSYVRPYMRQIPRPDWNVISWQTAWFAALQLEAKPTGDTFAATLQEE